MTWIHTLHNQYAAPPAWEMLLPLSEHARGQYREGQYNADFYVGGAMANTFPHENRDSWARN